MTIRHGGFEHYDDLRSFLEGLPITWYPDLVRAMVQASYRMGVWNPKGASRFISDVENGNVTDAQGVRGHGEIGSVLHDPHAHRRALEAKEREIHVVFDGPPGPTAGRFVEVEDAHGRGKDAGRWEEHGDYWHLVFDGKEVPSC